jgi:probable F420-dependent oxidoreductase
MRPFRFGLLHERFSTPAQVLGTAAQAEHAGFATFLIRDHLLDEPFGPQYAPWSTLAAVAQATTTLRVGTMVIANDFRHPAMLAKEVTTLDQLSGGRVELGIGAGFLREEYRQTGLPYDPNPVRVDRLEEALCVFDTLLRGEPLTYQGEHYQFDGFVNFPPPVQRPRPPLLIGGAGPRMLSLAARFGDCAALLPASLHLGELTDSAQVRSPEHVKAQVARLREAAGPRFDALELCLIVNVIAATDRRAAAETLAAQRGWSASIEEVLAMPGVLIGDTNAMVDHLQHVREEVDVSYVVVRDCHLNEAAGVVAQLAGR